MLTEHNDNQRTGENLDETKLTPPTLAPPTGAGLALKYTLPVDGQVVGQPLYVPGVNFPLVLEGTLCTDVRKDVVIVATQSNTVYVFDANYGTLLETRTLSPPALTTGYITTPYEGIFSTPVVDRVRGIVYLVEKEGRAGPAPAGEHGLKDYAFGYAFHIHALALGGSCSSPRVPLDDVYPPATIPDGKLVRKLVPPVGAPTTVYFLATQENQRPALLLAPDSAGIDRLYVAFGGQPQDDPPYGGFLFAYSTDLTYLDAITTSDNADGVAGDGTPWGAGIWQSGNGLAADNAGNVYFATGNLNVPEGTPPVESTPDELGNSVVRVQLDVNNKLQIKKYTPNNSKALSAGDLDLSAGGVVLLPHISKLGAPPFAVLSGGKEGVASLLGAGGLFPLYQEFHATFSYESCLPELCPSGNRARDDYPQIHGTPVYWKTAGGFGERVYVWAQRDYLRALAYSSAKGFPLDQTAMPFAQCGTKCPSYACADLDGGSLQCLSGIFPTVDCVAPASCNLAIGVSAAGAPVKSSLGMPGAILSLTASGSDASTGVLWASTLKYPDQGAADSESYWEPGILRAFAAEPVAGAAPGTSLVLKELWNNASEQYYFAKFTPPTVADGHVFLAGNMPGPCPSNPAVQDCQPNGFNPWAGSPSDVQGVLLIYGLP